MKKEVSLRRAQIASLLLTLSLSIMVASGIIAIIIGFFEVPNIVAITIVLGLFITSLSFIITGFIIGPKDLAGYITYPDNYYAYISYDAQGRPSTIFFPGGLPTKESSSDYEEKINEREDRKRIISLLEEINMRLTSDYKKQEEELESILKKLASDNDKE